MRIPNLTDLRRIGGGGFGTVYVAQQPTFQRTVAVKVLRATLDDPLAQQQFQRECTALGRLSGHPHILAVHEAGIDEQRRPYLVTPYLSNGSYGSGSRPPGRCLGARPPT